MIALIETSSNKDFFELFIRIGKSVSTYEDKQKVSQVEALINN